MKHSVQSIQLVCLLAGAALALLPSCGDTEVVDAPGAKPTDGSADNKSKEDAPGTKTEPPAAAVTAVDPQKFFNETLVALMRQNCSDCHAAKLSGPLTIFSYTAMLKKLDSTDARFTTLYSKVTGEISHGGGNMCLVDAKVCATIEEWHEAAAAANLLSEPPPGSPAAAAAAGGSGSQNGNSGTGGSSGTSFTGYGRLTADITYLGQVLGYAVDPNNIESAVEVAIYINGDNTSGTELYRGVANLPGPDDNRPGDHRFDFQIPETYRDGRAKQVYVYSVVGNNMHLLNAGNTTFYGYRHTTAGRNFYEQNVRPLLLQGCQGNCHSGAMNYETNFAWLLSPRPHAGGSKANNLHINNPAMANGEGHGGGNRCGGVNSGVCAQLQQWYELEFGGI